MEKETQNTKKVWGVTIIVLVVLGALILFSWWYKSAALDENKASQNVLQIGSGDDVIPQEKTQETKVDDVKVDVDNIDGEISKIEKEISSINADKDLSTESLNDL